MLPIDTFKSVPDDTVPVAPVVPVQFQPLKVLLAPSAALYLGIVVGIGTLTVVSPLHMQTGCGRFIAGAEAGVSKVSTELLPVNVGEVSLYSYKITEPFTVTVPAPL